MTPTAHPSRASFSVLPWADAIERFERPWVALLAATRFNPSLHPRWVSAVLEAFSLESEIRVLVAERDGRLVGVLPFLVRTRRLMALPVRTLELAGNIFSYHHELLCPGIEAEMLSELLRTASGERPDLVLAVNFLEEGPSTSALDHFAAASRCRLLRASGERSPSMKLSGSWEEFLNNQRKKFRYKLRRRAREMEAAGEFQVRWYREIGAISELWEAILRIESNSWKRSAGMAISDSPLERRYYEALLPFLAEEHLLLANVAWLDGVPIAYNLCYTWAGQVGQMKTSFDDSYGQFSPGAYLTATTIRHAFEQRYTEFDFLGDEMDHKLEWANFFRSHEIVFIFLPTLRGRVVGATKWVVDHLRRKFAGAPKPSGIQSRASSGPAPSG